MPVYSACVRERKIRVGGGLWGGERDIERGGMGLESRGVEGVGERKRTPHHKRGCGYLDHLLH